MYTFIYIIFIFNIFIKISKIFRFTRAVPYVMCIVLQCNNALQNFVDEDTL